VHDAVDEPGEVGEGCRFHFGDVLMDCWICGLLRVEVMEWWNEGWLSVTSDACLSTM
jgi:hypothetical protein